MASTTNVVDIDQHADQLNTDEVYQEVSDLFEKQQLTQGTPNVPQPYSIKAGRLLVGRGGKILDLDFESCTQLGCNFVDKLKMLEADSLYWKDLFSEQVTDAIVSLDFNGILKGHRHHELETVKLVSSSGMNLFAKISIWAIDHGGEQYAVVLVSDAKRKSHFDNMNQLVMSDSISDYASSLIWSFKDIFQKMDETQNRGLELLLFEMANIDVLTNIPNRKMFLHVLQKNLDETAESELFKTGAGLIKIDNLTQINDAYGLKKGDAVINEFARKVKSVLRSSDLIGRVSGTTFGIALPAVNNQHNLKIVAERILENVATLEALASDCKIKTSIGMTMLNDESDPLNKLLAHANAALTKAAKSKSNTYKIYE